MEVDAMKVTQNWPDDLVVELDKQAAALGITRTAYVVMSLKQKVQSDIMLQSMPDMQKLMSEVQIKLSKLTLDQTEEQTPPIFVNDLED